MIGGLLKGIIGIVKLLGLRILMKQFWWLGLAVALVMLISGRDEE